MRFVLQHNPGRQGPNQVPRGRGGAAANSPWKNQLACRCWHRAANPVGAGRFTVLIAALLAASLPGCGEPGPDLVPVGGRTTWNGQPLSAGAIFFQPLDGGLPASGLLQLDGTFQLRTYPHGPGAIPGEYRVYLQLGAGAKRGMEPYLAAEQSPLHVTVPPDGLTNCALDLPLPQDAR